MEEEAKDIIDNVARSKTSQEAQGTEDTSTISEEAEGSQTTSPAERIVEPQRKKTIWRTTATPEKRAQIAENRKKNSPLKIQGYLGDSKIYKDIVKYFQLSREQESPPISTNDAPNTSEPLATGPTSDSGSA